MRLTDPSHRSESSLKGLRRGLQLTLAVVTAVCLATGPGARATPLNYIFTSNASVVLAGDTEAISGSFTFDTATITETDVTITLTGPSPFSGTYTQGPAFDMGSNDEVLAGTPVYFSLPDMGIGFAADLNVPSDPLVSVSVEFSDRNGRNFHDGYRRGRRPRARHSRPPGRGSRSLPSRITGDPTQPPLTPDQPIRIVKPGPIAAGPPRSGTPSLDVGPERRGVVRPLPLLLT